MHPAFVISPIGEFGSLERIDADEVLEMFIRPAARKFGFEPYRGDSVSSPGMIATQMCQSILSDSLLFAYLKNGNPNVYYELAIAHTLKKPVVLLKDPSESIPFDIGSVRIVSLDRNNVSETLRQIEIQVRELIHPAHSITSPVDISPEQILASAMPQAANQGPPALDVSGIWTGYTIETFPADTKTLEKNYHSEMRLTSIGDYVTGSVFIAYGDDYKQPSRNTAMLQLHGTCRSPRFLRLQYDNERISHHCGLLFLEFNEDGSSAVGAFAGSGVASEQPVHGTVRMRRAE